MIGIYKITNIDNGKMYVGQSVDLKHRWAEHKCDLNNNKHSNNYLQKSWNSHGADKFVFSIIELCQINQLDEKEIYWINKLRTYVGFDDSNGYNLSLGGSGTKQLRPVLRFDLDGNLLDEWLSPRDASIVLGVDIQDIYGCTSKKYKYRHGYIWIWKSDYIDKTSLNWYLDRKCCRRVLQYDKNANVVCTYDSMSIAEKQLGYCIAQCLLHKTKSCHGYIFVYEDENIKIDKEYCNQVFSLLNNISNHPFYMVNKDGDIVKRYNCQREAIEDGYNERMISECLRGLRNKYKDFLWIYTDNYNEDEKYLYIDLYNICEARVDLPIIQIKNGVIINRYEHLKDIPDEYNKANVSSVCKGRKLQYKGYIWKYEVND